MGGAENDVQKWKGEQSMACWRPIFLSTKVEKGGFGLAQGKELEPRHFHEARTAWSAASEQGEARENRAHQREESTRLRICLHMSFGSFFFLSLHRRNENVKSALLVA